MITLKQCGNKRCKRGKDGKRKYKHMSKSGVYCCEACRLMAWRDRKGKQITLLAVEAKKMTTFIVFIVNMTSMYFLNFAIGSIISMEGVITLSLAVTWCFLRDVNFDG